MEYSYNIATGLSGIKSNAKKYIFGGLAALSISVMLIASSASALAATVANGGFESGTEPGVFTTVNPGGTNIDNWTVVSGSVDYIGTYWQPSEGSRSLDMSGNSAGVIRQTLTTVSGHTYMVTFAMAGNPDGGPVEKTLNVDTGGLPASYSFDTNGDKTSMGWVSKTYNFTATSSSTTLTFTSTTEGYYGAALDNVVVTDVLTNKDQCKKDGWKEYTNPSFKNQGDCVSFIATKGKNLPSGN